MANQNDGSIALENLPVKIFAYEDDNGYAIIITSDDKRIGNGQGELVDTLLVRVMRGDVPRVNGTCTVQVNDMQTQTIKVAATETDETGRLFVTDGATGQKMPVAKQPATPEQ